MRLAFVPILLIAVGLLASCHIVPGGDPSEGALPFATTASGSVAGTDAPVFTVEETTEPETAPPEFPNVTDEGYTKLY